MHEISASSRKIGDIIGLIDLIAFQTNIPGAERGRGSARAVSRAGALVVVASEVRSRPSAHFAAASDIKGAGSRAA